MTDRSDWVKKQISSGELSYEDVAQITQVMQAQNGLLPDGKPGPVTMQKVRELLLDQRRGAATEPPPPLTGVLTPEASGIAGTSPPPPPAGRFAPTASGSALTEPPPRAGLPNLSMPSSEWIKGIDVSHHQKISYEKLPNYLGFAFVKATEGTTSSDPSMSHHLRGLSLKIPFLGLYHFARPSSASPQGQPRGEAQNFARKWQEAMKDTERLLPPVLDIEDDRKVPSPHALVDWCAAWCEECERLTGRSPIIYSYASYLASELKEYGKLSPYLLWLADYRKAPPAMPNGVTGWLWTFWQYSSSGTIPGIAGSCDLNVVRGSLEELEALCTR